MTESNDGGLRGILATFAAGAGVALPAPGSLVALTSCGSLRTSGGTSGTGGTGYLVGKSKAFVSPALQPCHRSHVKQAIGTPVNSAATSHSHSRTTYPASGQKLPSQTSIISAVSVSA
jgi:hypothetical protein